MCITARWARPTYHAIHRCSWFDWVIQGSWYGGRLCPNHGIGRAVASGDTHIPLTHGEMGITLQDIDVMLGIPVDGLPVTRRTNLKWNEVCRVLLGHEPPPVIPNSNKSTLTGVKIKYKWLDAQFVAPLAANADDKVMQQNARYHLLVQMGALLFMEKSTNRVSLLTLPLFNPISNARQYSWGSAALAWLYRQLCSASKKDTMQIGGALLLVQLWAYSRFPQICLIKRPPLPLVHSRPLAIKYVHWVLVIHAKCLLGIIIYV